MLGRSVTWSERKESLDRNGKGGSGGSVAIRVGTSLLVAVERILPSNPVLTLDEYANAGGGQAIEAARRLGPVAVIEDVLASGLRGRGGAGFPTGRKWASVRERESRVLPTSVVVNGAEGEPGSFKDRAILRANPFAVLEGAIVAAHCVDADRVVVALRRSFTRELDIVERAMAELHDAGWSEDVALELFAGPDEYLFGEETGLLAVIDGHPPFPRVQPPYRHGVDEVFEDDTAEPEMAAPGGASIAPPTLVNNVETMANVPGIAFRGPAWYRELGTDDSPGTIVCTVSGDTVRAGVGEFGLGTPLQEIIDELGGGPRDGRSIAAVMSGVANALVPGDLLGTPASHEALQAVGSGLGAAGFIVFDDTTDFVAVAEGVSRFLSVESCGQCTPCKQEGQRITSLLDHLRQSDRTRETAELEVLDLDARLRNVTDSARCTLAQQHQTVVGSIRERWEVQLHEHATGVRPAVEPLLIAAIEDVRDGEAIVEARQRDKQPDWTFEPVDSGEAPADRYGEGRPEHYPPRLSLRG
jgi:NADH-quinone oxidoreductase subunit F